jgi:DNA polymerase
MSSTWDKVLESAGWPTTLLVIDFETFFDRDYTLREMSIPEYVNDARFEFVGVGWAEIKPGQDWHTHFVGGRTMVEDRIGPYFRHLYGENYEKVTVVIQNAHFDAYILREKFDILPPYVVDVKMLAHHHESRASAKLKDIATRLGLKPKGDTMQFSGLHWETMTLEQRQAMNEYCQRDANIEGNAALKWLPGISRPEIEIPMMRHTLKLWLSSPLRFDYTLGRELINKMTAMLEAKLAATGHTPKELNSPLQFSEILLEALPDGGKTLPLKKGKPTKRMVELTGQEGLIPAFAKTDDGFLELLNHPAEKVRLLCEAKQAAKSWPNHIGRIDNMMRMAEFNRGEFPVPLTYYGAHTGRWSGSEGINVQNLGSKSHELVNQIRNVILAPPGYSLLIVDWASIEARYLAWAAKQDDLVEGFRRNEDIYSVFAGKIFQARVRKAQKTDPAPLHDIYSVRRAFGKEGILGCGYGMGGNKFFIRIGQVEVLRAKIAAGIYDVNMAHKVVKAYRTTYPRIPKHWSKIEGAFRQAVRTENQWFESESGTSFIHTGHTVWMKLPSGRMMRYPHADIVQKADRDKIVWKHGELWGGSITENEDQAACRDILAEALLRCEDAGLPIIFHCHDELVSLAPDYKAKKELERMTNLMRITPSWCEGLPLDCEGMISKRYTK